MRTRTAARLGRPVSVIGLGTWQLGADWGEVTESEAMAILEASVEAGVTFFDTADVYGDGRSESIIGGVRRRPPRPRPPRRHEDRSPAWPRSRRTTRWRTSAAGSTDRAPTSATDTLDLVQLHCPPTAVIENDAVFDDLDTLVAEAAHRGATA